MCSKLTYPQAAALHFHLNESYDAYSHEAEGIKGVGGRDERTHTKVRCGWFMDDVWKHGQRRELEDKRKLKEAHQLRPEERWGCLWDATNDGPSHKLDPH